MQTLYIVLGKPGSGKSTYVKNHLSDIPHFEADMYFIAPDGKYKFDGSKLSDAHAWCRKNVKDTLIRGKDCVVSNTTLSDVELETYLSLAEDLVFEHNKNVVVNIVECTYKNIHNSKESSIFNSVHFTDDDYSYEALHKLADKFDRKDNANRKKRFDVYKQYENIITSVKVHQLNYNEKTNKYTETIVDYV